MCSCLPRVEKSSQRRQHKQSDSHVGEKQKETKAVRLLAKRDDLLTRVPSERKAHCNVVAAEACGNGCNHNRGEYKKRPFENGAHKRPNDPSSATAATRRADCNRDGPPLFAAAHVRRYGQIVVASVC